MRVRLNRVRLYLDDIERIARAMDFDATGVEIDAGDFRADAVGDLRDAPTDHLSRLYLRRHKPPYLEFAVTQHEAKLSCYNATIEAYQAAALIKTILEKRKRWTIRQYFGLQDVLSWTLLLVLSATVNIYLLLGPLGDTLGLAIATLLVTAFNLAIVPVGSILVLRHLPEHVPVILRPSTDAKPWHRRYQVELGFAIGIATLLVAVAAIYFAET